LEGHGNCFLGGDKSGGKRALWRGGEARSVSFVMHTLLPPPNAHVDPRAHPASVQLSSDVDLAALGKQCEGYSGSDLHELCRIAATAAAREAMRANAEVPVGGEQEEQFLVTRRLLLFYSHTFFTSGTAHSKTFCYGSQRCGVLRCRWNGRVLLVSRCCLGFVSMQKIYMKLAALWSAPLPMEWPCLLRKSCHWFRFHAKYIFIYEAKVHFF
jgi:hypothetical protein